MIVFDPACECGTRTMTFADGSTLVGFDTIFSTQTPGNSTNAPDASNSWGNPLSIDFSELIIGGTGRFAGASGSASGHATVVGNPNVVKLSGTVTF